MNCANCLTSLNPDARFCPTCGMAVGSTAAPAPAAPVAAPAPVAPNQVPAEAAPAYQPMYAAAPAPTSTNGLAIASLVLGLTGISIVALVLGYIARKQIRQSNGRQDGSGFATAGIVLGWIGTVLGTILVIAYIALIAWAVQNDPTFFDSNTYY